MTITSLVTSQWSAWAMRPNSTSWSCCSSHGSNATELHQTDQFLVYVRRGFSESVLEVHTECDSVLESGNSRCSTGPGQLFIWETMSAVSWTRCFYGILLFCMGFKESMVSDSATVEWESGAYCERAAPGSGRESWSWAFECASVSQVRVMQTGHNE